MAATEASQVSKKTIAAEQVPASVLCTERCHLGEGAGYDAETDTAWWFDILERRLFEAHLASGAITIHPLPFMASALAKIDGARQLLAAEDGLYVRDIAIGGLTLAARIEPDNPAVRSNDSRVHPSGTFWTSTMGRRAESGAGTIYAFRDGQIAPLFSGLTIPNAICFSPDGHTGYFADTRENTLYRVKLDPLTGLPAEAPSALHQRWESGGLDGAVTDAEGLIWCAIWGGACLNAYSPSGELVRSVQVPALQASCPAFAGGRLDGILVTSAYEGMDVAARSADPGHGQTFLLTAGVSGRPEPRVRLSGI